MKYRNPKGTFDLLPAFLCSPSEWKDINKWHFIERTLRELADNYGYEEVRTPVFEQTEVFTRSAGETSDIVSKEMYTFTDKASRNLSLRPEGTASTMRAYAQNKFMATSIAHKFFYIGPFFRYDRPQAGRFRQFHQFGIEAIGSGEPEQDFETIEMLYELLQRLKVKGLSVKINSIGDETTRKDYAQALKIFLEPYYGKLSSDSQKRFKVNPLRILDSKDPYEKDLIQNCPSILDYLSIPSKKHFDAVQNYLSENNVPFSVDHRLVRGLDYYNQTVFEVTTDFLGSQNSIGAGGRYDGLLPKLGGPDLPCIGFSVGIERIIQTMIGQKIRFPKPKSPKIAIVLLQKDLKQEAIKILHNLRHKRFSTIFIDLKTIQKSLKHAEQKSVLYTLILGDEEYQKQVIQVKDMKKRTSKLIPIAKIYTFFEDIYG